MKARHILICLALSLWGTGLQALAQDLPQVFSPNAAELGKYGKVPVSYFNGLPNISIPLTELRAKNYTLPIYLTYHASGNKPDQHPGWVGLGWTLHAGGCINRIVNGMKDEMTKDEYNNYYTVHASHHPGYYFHAGMVQQTDWNNSQIQRDSLRAQTKICDFDPDEFQVCLDDIQASFYFTGNGEVRIVSKTNADFKVDVRLIDGQSDPIIVYPGPHMGQDFGRAKRYFYFDRIIITSSDGTKYVFGEDDDAIEFSFSLIPSFSDPLHNNNYWTCPATASTWLLSRIERPDGEVVHFTYTKDGTPVIRHDTHHGGLSSLYHSPSDDFSFDTKNNPNYFENISFSLIKPSYLQSITCDQAPDKLDFLRSRTTELKYATRKEEFLLRAGNYTKEDTAGVHYSFEQIMAEDYYMKLQGIVGEGRHIMLTYSADTTRRLTLQNVVFLESLTQSDRRYSFGYNSERLPGYHARQSDLWGYYNGIDYSTTPSNMLEQVRKQVNPTKTQAEILTTIHYPTGGRTEITYEGNTYSQVVDQISLNLVAKTIDVPAGGVRVQSIKDIPAQGVAETRTFNYAKPSGLSSGILAGTPRQHIGGHHTYLYEAGDLPVYTGPDVWTYYGIYDIYSENSFRPLSTTEGSHITYSQVRETRADGSQTKFIYSNHDYPLCCDTKPEWRSEITDSLLLVPSFNSRELFRGLLLVKTEYDSSRRPFREELNEYQLDTSVSVKAVSSEKLYNCDRFFSEAPRKILAGFPYLKKKTVNDYSDNNTTHTEITEYTYDAHRRLTEVKRSSGGVVERDEYSYTGNCSGSPYSGMISRNMISLPVEHLTFRKVDQQAEKLIGAELVTWKSSGSYYVPSGNWSAGLGGTGVDAASFTVFSGTGKDSRYGNTPDLSYTHYDANGNLVLSEDRGVRPTTYLWTPDGCRPAAIVPGASVSYVRRDSSDVAKNQVYALTLGQTQIKEFECVAPFTLMLALMCPSGQNWFVEAYVDGERYPMTRINSSYTGGDWSGSGLGQYPFSLQIPLSGGAHSVRVRAGQNYHPDYATDIGCTFIINYREKKVTNTTVPGPTVVFEDFEEDGNHTAEAFRSGKSRKGVWTHALNESFGPYLVDYRVFRNGRWNYVRQSASGSSVAINEGTAPIDHVRIYPMGSLPESYTWWPDGNLRSRTDAQGVTESYRYDGLGRLTGVYDNDGNKVEGYQYNYQNR